MSSIEPVYLINAGGTGVNLYYKPPSTRCSRPTPLF